MPKKNIKKKKLTEDDVGALMFGIGLLTGVGSCLAVIGRTWEYSILAIVAALVTLKMLSRNM